MSKPSVTLITPTHDRHLLFSLTERWLKPALEKYEGEVQWIVADDGTKPVPLNLGQQRVSPDRPGEPGLPSFLGNMKRGLAAVKNDYVMIIEDDDWSCDDYINNMMSLFNKPDIKIVGEGCAKYYHMPTMSYYIHRNMKHASWCQTAFRADLLPEVIQVANRCKTYLLDMDVWSYCIQKVKVNTKRVSEWKVGIKGLMRDASLGAGHNTRMYRSKDPYGQVLTKWIGKEAKEVYFTLIRNRSVR